MYEQSKVNSSPPSFQLFSSHKHIRGPLLFLYFKSLIYYLFLYTGKNVSYCIFPGGLVEPVLDQAIVFCITGIL